MGDVGMGGGAAGGAGSKRKRGASTGITPQRRALLINSAILRKYPYSDYGRAYVRRGTPENLARFGATYKSASAEQQALRKAVGYVGKGLYRGRGGFWGDLVGKGLSAASPILSMIPGVGGALGRGAAMIAPHAGRIEDALANTAVGAGWRKLTGQGLYRGAGAYYANDLLMTPPGPFSFSAGDTVGNIRVSRTEYVTDVYGPESTGGFNPQTLPLNPGISTVFPWLSQIAQNYEEYTFHQLMFEFRPITAQFAAASGQIGTVDSVTQYNPSEPILTTLQDMRLYAHHAGGQVTDNVQQFVECDPAKNSGVSGKYVRAGPVPVGADLSTYDQGNTSFVVTGIPETYINKPLGQLYVSYTVELRKPKFWVNKGFGIERDVFCHPGWTPVGGPNFFSMTGMLTGQQNGIGGSLSTPSGEMWYTLPAGYEGNLELRVKVSSLASFAPQPIGWSVTGNVTLINDMLTLDDAGTVAWQAISNAQAPGTTQVSAATWTIHVRVRKSSDGVDNIIKFGLTSGLTDPALTVCQIDVCEYNTRFNTRQDGLDDRIILVNTMDQVIPVPA